MTRVTLFYPFASFAQFAAQNLVTTGFVHYRNTKSIYYRLYRGGLIIRDKENRYGSVRLTRIADRRFHRPVGLRAEKTARAWIGIGQGHPGFQRRNQRERLIAGRREERNGQAGETGWPCPIPIQADRKSTRLNSSHVAISYAVFCLKKKIQKK